MSTPQPTEEQIQSALAWINGEMTPERKAVLMKEPYPSTNESQLRFRVMKILAAALAASRRDALRFQELNEVYGKSRDSRGYEMNCVLHYGIKTLPELADMMLARSRHRVEMAAIDAAAKGASE